MDAGASRASITVLVAVAVRLYRDGMAETLNGREHLQVVGAAATSLDAVAAIQATQPDIVIVDITLEDVLGLMRAVRTYSPKSRIVAFAVQEDVSTILDYAEAGADGFVTTNSSVNELVEAIERTAAGELLCSPRIAAELLQRAAQQSNREAREVGALLTHREQQVFSLLKQGQSNKEIAISLNIAEATVKNHVHHLLEKLQVETRGQAVAATLHPAKATLGQRRSRAS